MPSSPVKNAVSAPIVITTERAASLCSNNGDMRATMKMPAVTIVAAWINAEIGVGPSIESGSQTCNGTCADLPIAPTKRQMHANVSNDQCAPEKISMLVPASRSACSNVSV
jgi:hypothetical protein